jgi:hypothetical protein
MTPKAPLTPNDVAALAFVALRTVGAFEKLSRVDVAAVEGVALQALYNLAQRGLRGGAPRPKAEGAGAARSEDTSTEFPVAKKT